MNKICHLIVFLAIFSVLGCAPSPLQPTKIEDTLTRELDAAAQAQARAPATNRVQELLLPPLAGDPALGAARPIEPRFDLSVNDTPARLVFFSIVNGTRYSMLVHPEVNGAITVRLKDVTVPEAMEAIRDLYGYEYRIDGTRILVQPAGLQTRVFRVNYLIGQRLGRTDIRVTSGSVSDTPTGINATQAGTVPAIAAGGTGAANTGPGSTAGASSASPIAAGPAGRVSDSSRIQTQVRNDFWGDLHDTLRAIVGTEGGRNIIVNPQAGIVVVRAMPQEIRSIESYLNAIRGSVERQVMLEAKIVEVTLSEQFQSGVNWSAFPTNGIAGGYMGNNTTLNTRGILTSPALTGNPANSAMTTGALAGTILSGTPGPGLFGLALQTSNFAALLQFLESQGTVQVLSSPRIATMNNQKAVLKVGTDEFFLTNISGGTSTTSAAVAGTATSTFPTLTLQPFFTGVALDVTPQISDDGGVILHVRPAVSRVLQDDRNINLGTNFGGVITLPLARSTVSETDSIVRVQDSNIVAIGGLMKVDITDDRSGLPGSTGGMANGGNLFGSRQRTSVKRELVVLIKPTLIRTDADWAEETRQVRDRINSMGGTPPGQR